MKIGILIDEKGYIKSYAACLYENHIPLEECLIVETNLDIENINLSKEYKYDDETLIELTKEEKEVLNKEEVKAATDQEKINSTLIQQNAEIQLQLKKQQTLNATLLKQIADLKGDK